MLKPLSLALAGLLFCGFFCFVFFMSTHVFVLFMLPANLILRDMCQISHILHLISLRRLRAVCEQRQCSNHKTIGQIFHSGTVHLLEILIKDCVMN